MVIAAPVFHFKLPAPQSYPFAGFSFQPGLNSRDGISSDLSMQNVQWKYYASRLCDFAVNSLVSTTKSCTLNCSARLSRKGTLEGSALFSFMSCFNALRKVFLRWLNPAFTTFLNCTSSQSRCFTSFLASRITADFTFGGGEKTFSCTVKRYSMR